MYIIEEYDRKNRTGTSKQCHLKHYTSEKKVFVCVKISRSSTYWRFCLVSFSSLPRISVIWVSSCCKSICKCVRENNAIKWKSMVRKKELRFIIGNNYTKTHCKRVHFGVSWCNSVLTLVLDLLQLRALNLRIKETKESVNKEIKILTYHAISYRNWRNISSQRATSCAYLRTKTFTVGFSCQVWMNMCTKASIRVQQYNITHCSETRLKQVAVIHTEWSGQQRRISSSSVQYNTIHYDTI